MMELIKSFLNWLFQTPLFAPLFEFLGWEVFFVTPNAVRNYAINGVELYWTRFVPIVIALVIVLFLIRLFGLLNLGNLTRLFKKDEQVKNSPLKCKHFIFLGSSVTKGFAAYGKSFVDMIAARNGAVCVKEAVSGTTLADNGSKSYVSRLKALDPKTPCDLFVCQLSTNDATKKVPLGAMAAGKDMSSFDTKTVCGAIEYIIAYAKQTWNCPVVFYTNPQYASPAYKAMVEALKKIADKWGIQVIDLWDNKEFTDNYRKHTYMNDQIHPTRKGYEVWTPVFETALINVLVGKPVPAPAQVEVPTDEGVRKAVTRRRVVKGVKGVVYTVLALALVVGLCGYQQWATLFRVNDPGNAAQYAPENQPVNENSPLKGKNILFVGSSVVEGMSAVGDSMVEYIGAIDQCNTIKESVNGSTIAYQDDSSYCVRLMNHTAEEDIDAVVIQLSTNDANQDTPRGEIGESFDMEDFDRTTTLGALQQMFAYCKETWDCPVLVFTITKYGGSGDLDARYAELIGQVAEVCDKWGYGLLDMYNNEELNDITQEQYDFWMTNPAHPRRAGYLEWWLPEFQEALYAYFE